MSGKRILVVEDDPKTTQLIDLYLSNDGFEVITASDGRTGLDLAREHDPALVVLDLMLPGMDGLQLCRTLREESDPLIIMLTARSTEHDKLIGLNTGADDYVVKPFSPRELAARVRAVLRRHPEDSILRGPNRLTAAGLTVDVARQSVTAGDENVALTAVEFRLLVTLMREPGQVFNRAQLVESVFGQNYDGFDRSIDVHILKLRRKIERQQPAHRYIRTVYGSGYKFSEDAE